MSLNSQQEAALKQMLDFVLVSNDTYFVLDGMAGCGKTFLVSYFLERLAEIYITMKDINVEVINYTNMLCAPTHKAVDALKDATVLPAETIHSALHLTIRRDYEKNTQYLMRRSDAPMQHLKLILIDEASFIDETLIKYIAKGTDSCKIIYMGDPAQLRPVDSLNCPVFNKGYETAKLTQIMRQADNNPIQKFSVGLRDYVLGNKFPDVDLVPGHIELLSPQDFLAELTKEMSRPDWHYKDSKFLAWTNKRVIAANSYISNIVRGRPDFQAGDYATNNHHVQGNRHRLKTDQNVHILTMSPPTTMYGVAGKYVNIHNHQYFLPDDPSQIEKAGKAQHALGNTHNVQVIHENWIDLRPEFACTVNKSQGSTYGTVFIDLDDISKCKDVDLRRRMLYVAVSRARTRVVMMGAYKS